MSKNLALIYKQDANFCSLYSYSWKQYFEPLRSQGKKLVAPAITSSSNQGQGLSWLDEFVAACNGCHFDAYAFHPYAPDANAVKGSVDYFVNYKSE